LAKQQNAPHENSFATHYGRGSDRIRRRDFVTLIGGAAAAWPRAARRQQPNQIARIGYLSQESATFEARIKERGPPEARAMNPLCAGRIFWRASAGKPIARDRPPHAGFLLKLARGIGEKASTSELPPIRFGNDSRRFV